MLNRRNFLRKSGIALLGLAGLVNTDSNLDASPSPHYNASKPLRMENLQREIEAIREEIKHARKRMIFSYEEWKAVKEAPESPKNIKEIIRKAIAKSNLRNKAILIIKNSDDAYQLLTKEEVDSYKGELKMMIDPASDRKDINKNYDLNLSPEEFQAKGAKLLWFLDREYNYRYSDEKARQKNK